MWPGSPLRILLFTGCAQFLTRSELDQAREILDALFDSVLRHLNPPIVEETEHIYYDFQRQLSLMELNTVCT